MSLSNCKFRTLNFLFLVLACFSLIGCKAELSDYDKRISWNYKMTVEVMTPDGIKTGSAVREITIVKKAVSWDDINNKPNYSHEYNVAGEAVVVELLDDNKLFVLLSDDVYHDVLSAFDLKGYDEIDILQIGQKSRLPLKDYPKIVTFEDSNDPLSVVLIYGTNVEKKHYGQAEYVLQNNFDNYFGDGFVLQDIVIELTEEPAQYRVRKDLPFLVNINSGRLDGNRFESNKAKNRLANRLSAGAFTTKRGD